MELETKEIHPNDPYSFTVMETVLLVKKTNKDAVLPYRATSGAAGYDLTSPIDTTVASHGKQLINLGFEMSIPEGHYGRIAPRSSLSWKHFIDVGAGVIDSDYRGDVGVILYNHSDRGYKIKKGDRIAQLILEKISIPKVVEVNNLFPTARGEGGYGSTDKN